MDPDEVAGYSAACSNSASPRRLPEGSGARYSRALPRNYQTPWRAIRLHRRDPPGAIPRPEPALASTLCSRVRLAGLIRDDFNVEDAFEDAIRHATRPNGSLNYTLLLAHLEKRLAMLIASRSGGGEDAPGAKPA